MMMKHDLNRLNDNDLIFFESEMYTNDGVELITVDRPCNAFPLN